MGQIKKTFLGHWSGLQLSRLGEPVLGWQEWKPMWSSEFNRHVIRAYSFCLEKKKIYKMSIWLDDSSEIQRCLLLHNMLNYEP